MTNHNPNFPILAGLLLVVAGTVAACGGEATSAAERSSGEAGAAEPVAVELAAATVQSLPLLTRATGSLEPLRRVSPGTKILGRVQHVAVREGDRVDEGTLLARLESRDLEAAVSQAEAAVRMAEARLENSRTQLERMRELHQRGSVTDKNLEDATAAHRVAEAALDQAEADVAAARVTLGYAEIVSPIRGWVVEKRAEAGDMATPGTPLFTLEDLSRVEVVVEVPEADVVGLENGAPARLAILGHEHQAAVDRVVPSGHPASRTFSVKLLLDNPDGVLKSGMFAQASFLRGERRAVTVPETALVARGQLEGLFIAGDDGRLRLRWVKTGRREAGRAEVLSGLDEGERYVVAPSSGLADGMPYR